MQGIPTHDDALFACGVTKLFDHTIVSAAALRKMAGNSFSQPCMTAFIGFALSHLRLRSLCDQDSNPDGAGAAGNSKHILYQSVDMVHGSEDEDDQSVGDGDVQGEKE